MNTHPHFGFFHITWRAAWPSFAVAAALGVVIIVALIALANESLPAQFAPFLVSVSTAFTGAMLSGVCYLMTEGRAARIVTMTTGSLVLITGLVCWYFAAAFQIIVDVADASVWSLW